MYIDCTPTHELSRTREEAGGEPLKLGLHAHGPVLIDPPAGFDVDLLTRGELQPHDPLRAGREGVDEESGATEEHVRGASGHRDRHTGDDVLEHMRHHTGVADDPY
jgi:hypothetical protein